MSIDRETWLGKLSETLKKLFEEKGKTVPEKVRVACGFPSSQPRKHLGECWSAEKSADGTFEIFINPSLDDGIEVAACLVHELVHATVGLKEKHRGEFRKLAKALGLEGKMTSTHAGETLKERLTDILGKMERYPHARLDLHREKKQGTRMLKIVCPTCGYTVRAANKWIEVGLPTCCCGEKMEAV